MLIFVELINFMDYLVYSEIEMITRVSKVGCIVYKLSISLTISKEVLPEKRIYHECDDVEISVTCSRDEVTSR